MKSDAAEHDALRLPEARILSKDQAAGYLGIGVTLLAELGVPNAGGTVIFSVSGHVEKPGNYELPMGIPFRELMEICGGQTHSILKFGLDQLLPANLTLVHGPGCPVCVTPLELIDRAIAIAWPKPVLAPLTRATRPERSKGFVTAGLT